MSDRQLTDRIHTAFGLKDTDMRIIVHAAGGG